MISMAVFDVDNTLYSHKTYSVPPKAVEALALLRRKGVKVVISTGRPKYLLKGVLPDSIHPDYVMACNGHAVYDSQGRLLNAHYFSIKQMDCLTDYCLQHNFILYFKFLDAGYAYCRGDEFLQLYHIERTAGLFYDCPQHNHHSESQRATGAMATMPAERAWEYGISFDPTVRMVSFGINGYDVCLAGVGKGTALADLLAELHMSKEEVIGFGDSLNDVELLKACGSKVAMGTCAQQLLYIADYQTTDIEQDGIVNGLDHFGLL